MVLFAWLLLVVLIGFCFVNVVVGTVVCAVGFDDVVVAIVVVVVLVVGVVVVVVSVVVGVVDVLAVVCAVG